MNDEGTADFKTEFISERKQAPISFNQKENGVIKPPEGGWYGQAEVTAE